MPETKTLATAEKTVLVIDDSPSVCLAIERMLKPRGYAVAKARSGQEAISMLQLQVPDMILCDMLLEDTPGVEICRRVRLSKRLRRVPVVLISGQATEEMEHQAAGVGADGVLRKPFRADILIEKIERLLASRDATHGPRESESLGSARQFLDSLERIPGLSACTWRLESGRGWRQPPGPGQGAVHADPDALLADLRKAAAVAGMGALEAASLHGRQGEVLLVGQRQGAGALVVHLAAGSSYGRARYLTSRILRAFPQNSTTEHPRKELSS